MTQRDMPSSGSIPKEVGLPQNPGNGTSPMMQTFAQYQQVNQPNKNAPEATKDELENPTKPATGAIRTKPDSILNQARQIYNTQLNNNQA